MTAGLEPDRTGGGPEPDSDLGTFLRLSEVLLDARDLDPGFGAECMRLVTGAAPTTYGDGDVPPMQALLGTFAELEQDPVDLEARTCAVLYADLTLGPMTRNVIIAWYTGALGADVVSAEHYGAALVWPAISADPPGLPGRYYGAWAHPPPSVVHPPGDHD